MTLPPETLEYLKITFYDHRPVVFTPPISGPKGPHESPLLGLFTTDHGVSYVQSRDY